MSCDKYVILGLDPGLVKTGWGVISSAPSGVKYIDCGIIKTKPSSQMEVRLTFIYDSVQDLISSFNPKFVAMEEIFVNTNSKTSEKLIMARTASFISASKAGFVINGYPPNKIKKNITGFGHASKEQIHRMIQGIFGENIKQDKEHTFDSMDALAVALCHAFSNGKHIRC
ncbi:MAG: crossover junction endodeoxyribonuclease RuvC [Holosporales bacterium]|jgi:crossover junction endodeoxyribonuclease RuvC|nr:crossover junction endodeoxyribonuclease RuvC [Holosporales bacterium]